MVPGALQKKGKKKGRKKGTHTPRLHPQILLWGLPSEDCGALWWELGHASCPWPLLQTQMPTPTHS